MTAQYPGAADDLINWIYLLTKKQVLGIIRFHQAYGYARGLCDGSAVGANFNCWGFATKYVAWQREGVVGDLREGMKMYRVMHPPKVSGIDIEGEPFYPGYDEL